MSRMIKHLRVDVASAHAVVSLKKTDTPLGSLSDGVVATEAMDTMPRCLESLSDAIGTQPLVDQSLDGLYVHGSILVSRKSPFQ